MEAKCKNDCLNNIRKQLKEDDKMINWVRFDASTITSMAKDGVYKTGQLLSYGFTHTKKDGTTIDKIEKSFVAHNYCPFCGTKYD